MVSKTGYHGVDTYVEGLGTVRECIDCAALIAGGPTRCIRCAKEGAPKHPLCRMFFPRFFHRREVRQIRRARERERPRGSGGLWMRIGHAFLGHPLEMVYDDTLASILCECGWRLSRGDYP